MRNKTSGRLKKFMEEKKKYQNTGLRSSDVYYQLQQKTAEHLPSNFKIKAASPDAHVEKNLHIQFLCPEQSYLNNYKREPATTLKILLNGHFYTINTDHAFMRNNHSWTSLASYCYILQSSFQTANLRMSKHNF